MNERKKIARRKQRKTASNKPVKKGWIVMDEYEKFITKMTNWQNSQWLRAGKVRSEADSFANMFAAKLASPYTIKRLTP